jgi:beta-glucosidase
MPTRTPEQYPGVKDQVNYSERLEIGYRWFDAQRITPLFPFGFGLSYTKFSFARLKIAKSGSGAKVTFTIRNTGKREGADVSQVYVTFPKALGEPPRQLKGFKKVNLDPGEAQRVTIRLNSRAFSYWNSAKKGWTRARGCYGISVGDSSRSLPLKGVLGIGRGTSRKCAAK